MHSYIWNEIQNICGELFNMSTRSSGKFNQDFLYAPSFSFHSLFLSEILPQFGSANHVILFSPCEPSSWRSLNSKWTCTYIYQICSHLCCCQLSFQCVIMETLLQTIHLRFIISSAHKAWTMPTELAYHDVPLMDNDIVIWKGGWGAMCVWIWVSVLHSTVVIAVSYCRCGSNLHLSPITSEGSQINSNSPAWQVSDIYPLNGFKRVFISAPRVRNLAVFNITAPGANKVVFIFSHVTNTNNSCLTST